MLGFAWALLVLSLFFFFYPRVGENVPQGLFLAFSCAAIDGL